MGAARPVDAVEPSLRDERLHAAAGQRCGLGQLGDPRRDRHLLGDRRRRQPLPRAHLGHAEPLLGVAGLVVDRGDDPGGLVPAGLRDAQGGRIDVHLPGLEAEAPGRAAAE
jgi:hypothetical protein